MLLFATTQSFKYGECRTVIRLSHAEKILCAITTRKEKKKMVQFSSSQQSGQITVAATTLTTIFQIQVPKGRQYSLRRLWGGCAQKGTMVISQDTLPSLSAEYIYNSTDPDVISNDSQGWPLAIEAIGPCTVTVSSKNASATSTTVRCMVSYIDSGGSG